MYEQQQYNSHQEEAAGSLEVACQVPDMKELQMKHCGNRTQYYQYQSDSSSKVCNPF
jgi:hypothetical protein